jgi:hypothetical protein
MLAGGLLGNVLHLTTSGLLGNVLGLIIGGLLGCAANCITRLLGMTGLLGSAYMTGLLGWMAPRRLA